MSAEPDHLGPGVSGPVLLGVRSGIEGRCGRWESACECPVGHDERVLVTARQTDSHGGQHGPCGEHVIAGKVRLVVKGAGARSPGDCHRAALAATTAATREPPSLLASSNAPYPPMDHPIRAMRSVSSPLRASSARSSWTMMLAGSMPHRRACQQKLPPSTVATASQVCATWRSTWTLSKGQSASPP